MSKTSFIFTGDSFITRRLPENGYPGFKEISEIICRHDVRFNNLEITVHQNEGYPEALSGGTWAMTEPVVLDDLTRFGFNVYNTANNHSADYGHGGLLATLKNLRERNLACCGTGRNLAEASAPAYLETENARAAVIGVCSSFHKNAAAGNARIDIMGRPGLNPLSSNKTYKVTEEYFKALQDIAEKTKINASMEKSIKNGYAPPLSEGKLNFGGLSFELAEYNKLVTKPGEKDMQRIAASIQEAGTQADYVIVSLHAHEDEDGDEAIPAEFIRTFARACIDCGAHAVVGHGPHVLRGIEIYNGRPIIYSLGNFIFETETISVQPADAYEKHSMSNTATVGEYMNNRSKNGTRGYGVQPNIWRAVMAGMTAENGAVTQIQLYPITLHMNEPSYRKGVPELSFNEKILEYLQELSKPFGTEISIVDGIGYIDL